MEQQATGAAGVERNQVMRGLKVVDLGVGMPPALISKYLAELGASVMAFPPTGDPTAQVYPAYGAWRSLHQILAPDDAAIEGALATADICILGGEDFPGVLAGRDAQKLSEAYPDLIVLKIESYPGGSAAAGRPGVDVLVQARSGFAFEHLDDRPLRVSFEPSLYGAVVQGLQGVLAALIDRTRSSKGQVVSTSLFEGLLTWAAATWVSAEKPDAYLAFVTPRGAQSLIFRCADGEYIHFVIGAPGSKYAVYQLLGIEDPSVTPQSSGLPDPTASPRNFFGDYDLLERHVRTWACDDLVAALGARGLPAVRVRRPGECWDEPQMAMNGIIAKDETGRRHVGNPVIFSASPAPAAAPLPAADTPLAGMRVVDLGMFVAGPASSVVLGDLGADVIKVEQIGGDPSRVMFRPFAASNRGKRTICLDMKNERGREICRRLLGGADVVHSNFRTGVSERLGVDPAALHSLRPDMVVLESSAWGPLGPMADQTGFDPVAQAFSGMESRAGGDGNPPFWSSTYVGDYSGAALGGISILTGLYNRLANGPGASLNVPLAHGNIFLLSELVQNADGRFAGAPPLNAAQTGYHPTEAFYATKDGWIAIAARGDAAAGRLAQALGLAQSPETPASDWSAAEEALIAERVATLTCGEALALLASADVWAELCERNVEKKVLEDVALRALGTIHTSVHPTYGRMAEIGPLMRFSRSTRGGSRHTPGRGEHTAEILRDLGYGEPEIEAFYRDRVVA